MMDPESFRLRASSDPSTTNHKQFLQQHVHQRWVDHSEPESLEAIREQHANNMADILYINQDLTWELQESLAHERDQTIRAQVFHRMFQSAKQRLSMARTVRGQVMETLSSVRETMDQLEKDILLLRQNMRASEGTMEELRKGRDASALQPTPSLIRPSPSLSIPTAPPWQSRSGSEVSTSQGSALDSPPGSLLGELSLSRSFSRHSSGVSPWSMGSMPSPTGPLFGRHDLLHEEAAEHEAALNATGPVITALSRGRAAEPTMPTHDAAVPEVVTSPDSALPLDVDIASSPDLSSTPQYPKTLYLTSPPRWPRSSHRLPARAVSDGSRARSESRQGREWSTSDASGSRLTESSYTSLISISSGKGSYKDAAKPTEEDQSRKPKTDWSVSSKVSSVGPSEEKARGSEEERDGLIARQMSLSERLEQKINQASSTSRIAETPVVNVENMPEEAAATAPLASASEHLIESLARAVIAVNEAQSERQSRGLSPLDFGLRAGPDGYVLLESGSGTKPLQLDQELVPSPLNVIHRSTTAPTATTAATTATRKVLRLRLAHIAASALQLAIGLVVFTLINALVAIREEWRCGNVSQVKRNEIMSWRSDLVGWDVIDWIRYQVAVWLDANRELNV
ncbi:hypothetical protein DV738_g3151, partial [Chaetothyriales sp. CBS 135597]